MCCRTPQSASPGCGTYKTQQVKLLGKGKESCYETFCPGAFANSSKHKTIMHWNRTYLNRLAAMWHVYNPYLQSKYQWNTRQKLFKTCGSLTWNILFSCPWQGLLKAQPCLGKTVVVLPHLCPDRREEWHGCHFSLRSPKPLALSWNKPGILTGGTGAQTPHKLPCLVFFTWQQNAVFNRNGGAPLIGPRENPDKRWRY